MIVDILVLAVLLISALIAFLRGFIREVLTIAGVVGGLAAAYFGGPLLAPVVSGWFGVEEGVEPERLFGVLPYDIVADVVAYGSIFIIVVITLSILSHVLAEVAQNIGLGAIDRTLGFIFGALRGVVLLGLLYLPVHLFIDDTAKNSWFENSRTHFYIERTSEALTSFLPEDAEEKAEEGLKKVEEMSNTKKKLEDLNILNSGKNTPTIKNEELQEPQGYDEDFRDKMDELFEEKLPETEQRKVNE